MEDKIPDDKLIGFDPWTAAVREELSANPTLYSCALTDDMTVDVQAGRDSLWLVVRGPGAGGMAFRTTYAPGGSLKVSVDAPGEHSAGLTGQTPLGKFEVKMEALDGRILHWTTTLTPKFDLTLPFGPRDVYPLDQNGDPTGAHGTAHAGQPTTGAAIVFLTLSEPAFGSALYVQNFSALNPLYETLGTIPSGLVGGKWPQLGYALPPSDTCLPAHKEIVISDAFVCLSSERPENE